MDVRELRIDNWVSLCTAGEIWTERQIKANEFLAAYKHPEWIKPIPLTPEWFLKFGITHYDEFVYRINEDFKISKFGPVYYEGVDSVLNVISNVKYVHQLQNLYFALTGKELELKQLV